MGHVAGWAWHLPRSRGDSGFFEGWIGAYEDFQIEPEHIVPLGKGVMLAVVSQSGRPIGSGSRVQLAYVSVAEWTEGLIARVTHYTDIDDARAAGERIAEDRA